MIADMFSKSCNEIEKDNPEISTRFKRVDAEKMKCVIYVNGEAKAQCGIWINNQHTSRQILISWCSTTIGSSYNEALHVEHDDYDLYLNTMMGFTFGENLPINMTSAMASKYLWERFIDQFR